MPAQAKTLRHTASNKQTRMHPFVSIFPPDKNELPVDRVCFCEK
jgi:hypothetical protein